MTSSYAPVYEIKLIVVICDRVFPYFFFLSFLRFVIVFNESLPCVSPNAYTYNDRYVLSIRVCVLGRDRNRFFFFSFIDVKTVKSPNRRRS